MGELIKIQPSGMDAFWKKLAKDKRITYAYVLLQVEDEEGLVSWCVEEAGDRSADPDHLITLAGHHTIATNFLARAIEESILDGIEYD